MPYYKLQANFGADVVTSPYNNEPNVTVAGGKLTLGFDPESYIN